MRLGATLLLRGGRCYQSYGWSTFRPLGDLQTAISILGQYEVDEISIIRPDRKGDLSACFKEDLAILATIKTNTPLSFGGGLRSVGDIEGLADAPVERLCFSSAFIDRNAELIERAVALFGKQAIVACLPLRVNNEKLEIFNCNQNRFVNFSQEIRDFFSQYADELICYDVNNEGFNDQFDMRLAEGLATPNSKIILSGGVGKHTVKLAKQKGFAAVLIDNRMLHRENAVEYFR